MKATLEAHFGTDLDVVNAARVSFANKSDWDYHKRNKGEANFVGKTLKERDANLIQYLARGLRKSEWDELIGEIVLTSETMHSAGPSYDKGETHLTQIISDLMNMAQHWVPFTHTYIKFHMVAPVPIARQCFKHKVGFTESEESRRYIMTTPTVYIPDEFRSKAADIKQGSGGRHPNSDEWVSRYTKLVTDSIATYEEMLKDGVCPEQARFALVQGAEVQWIWSGNLASFARFVLQRTDPHAQLESQILAKQVSDQIAPLFPVSWAALVNSGRTFDVE